MGEQNFSWKVALAARCSSVHFDKKTKNQLYLQPGGMDVHQDSLTIAGNLLMSLGASKPSRQMTGIQITPPAPRTTSIISIYSPVNKE